MLGTRWEIFKVPDLPWKWGPSPFRRCVQKFNVMSNYFTDNSGIAKLESVVVGSQETFMFRIYPGSDMASL